jgi:hypothetical protein
MQMFVPLLACQAVPLRCPLISGENQVTAAQHQLNILSSLVVVAVVKADQVGVWLVVAALVVTERRQGWL